MVNGLKDTTRQLFRFSAPGLDDINLAVPVEIIQTVAPGSPVRSLPLAPTSLMGLREWDGYPLPMIHMADLLSEDSLPQRTVFHHLHLIVRLVVDEEELLAAWPISPGSGVVSVPAKLPRADVPKALRSELIYGALELHDQVLCLLHIDRLLTAITQANNT